MEAVTFIGLGQMGATLARLALAQGRRVTVWNRTPTRAEPLVRSGAQPAATPAEAVAAGDVIVVCVHDYAASDAILRTPAVEARLAGRVLLQLTTGSPQEARDSEAWARRLGAEYLDGAIQAAPAQMGREDAVILVSGDEATHRRLEPLLRVFGGPSYLGAQAGAAAIMDMATLSYVYGSIVGFVQGAHLAQAEGLRVDAYASLVSAMAPAMVEFLVHEGGVIQSGDFAVSQSPMRINIEATERIARVARQAGISTEFPSFVAELFRRADAAGYGNEELAALIKVFRPGARPPSA